MADRALVVTADVTNEASVAGQWVASITYKSSATAEPSTGDLHALVSQARDRNRRLDITGMLLFENGSFLQTIEGPPPAIAAVWESIQRDSRHQGTRVRVCTARASSACAVTSQAEAWG